MRTKFALALCLAHTVFAILFAERTSVFFVEVTDRSCSSRPVAGRSSESTGISARALASVRVRAVACSFG